MIGFATYNLLRYSAGDQEDGERGDTAEQARQQRVRQVVAGLHAAARMSGGALVLAVQELHAGEPGQPGGIAGTSVERTAGLRLSELAEAAGMRCEYAPGRPAVALGGHGLHTGLMWSPEITPAGGWAAVGGPDLWHSLAILGLDVGATEPVVHASYQATPVGRGRRSDEAERVLLALTRPARPVLLGQDANSVSAARVPAAGWDDEHPPGRDPAAAPTSAAPHSGPPMSLAPTVFYDRDPYRGPGRTWHPDLVYQCAVTVDHAGRRSWEADRGPGLVLIHGGLQDTAALLGVPWSPTTGHWPGDPFGPRRIDTILASAHLAPAMTGHVVVREPLTTPLTTPLASPPSPPPGGATSTARAVPGQADPGTVDPGTVDPGAASDHLPVLVSYDPGAISTGGRTGA